MSKKTTLTEIVSKSLLFWYLTASVTLVFVFAKNSIFEYEIWFIYVFIWMSAKAVVWLI